MEEIREREMTGGEAAELSLAYWSGRAEEFSGLRMKDYASPMREAFKGFLGEQAGEVKKNLGQGTLRALDAGCGAGFFSLILAELGCKVTGIDFSEEMLGQAEKNTREKGLSGIGFARMDIQELEFSEASFDLIVTRNVLWVLSEAERAYRELMRVLRPGGRLINMDANYGQAFNQADARGETPSHPTQTLEQLKLRNRIARDLPVTRADRPLWDLKVLWDCGARQVSCIRDMEAYLGIRQWNQNYTVASKESRAVMFGVIAQK